MAKAKQIIWTVFKYFTLILGAFVSVLPVIVCVITAFKTFDESNHDGGIEFALVVDSHDARVEATVVAFCLVDDLHGFILRGARDGTGWELGIEDFAQMLPVIFGQATADF